MRLNRSTDIALRIAILAGGHQGGRLTVDLLAERLDVPRNHVAKVVQRLQRMGVLVTARGRSGGVAFAEHAPDITVGDVVRQLEGVGEVVNCAEPPCPLLDGCRLRPGLARAKEAFLATLDELRLGDLTGASAGRLRPLPPVASLVSDQAPA